MSAYLANPKFAPHGGILALHAWWGLNDVFKTLCDRLAAEGYLVVAPDLYNGKIATTIAEARTLRDEMIALGSAQRQVRNALQILKSEVPGAALAVMGFSLGAYFALLLAEEMPEEFAATVLFYGTRAGDYSGTKAAVLAHFAATDDFVPAEDRDALERSLRAASNEATFYVYPGTGHWFFESDRPAYNAQAAGLAWQRTLAFLRQHLDAAL